MKISSGLSSWAILFPIPKSRRFDSVKFASPRPLIRTRLERPYRVGTPITVVELAESGAARHVGHSMSSVAAASPTLFALLAFNSSNQMAVRRLGSKLGVAFTGSDMAMATSRLETSLPVHTPPAEYFSCAVGGRSYRVLFVQVSGVPADSEIVFYSLEALATTPESLAPSLATLLNELEPYLVEIPYLH